MASYPGSIPALGTVTSADNITTAQFNTPNDEIEAIATELGVNPSLINDTVTPTSSPASVAAYLDMVANIFKTMTGAETWYKSESPARFCVYGHLNNATVAPGATIYPAIFGKSSSATESHTQIDVPFDVIFDNLWIFVGTMPSGVNDTLTIAMRQNGVDKFDLYTGVPPGWSGIFHKQMVEFASNNDSWAAGDKLSLRLTMGASASAASGTLGAWGIEGRQKG